MTPPLKVTRVTDSAGLELLKDFFARVKAAGGIIGWDIETTPVKDFFFRKVRTIQFGNLVEQYVIDLKAFCYGDSLFSNDPHATTAADTLRDCQGHYGKNIHPLLQTVLETIRPVVCTKDFLKVGVNLSFEYMNFYWQFGMRTFHFFDCTMVEKCIYAGAHSMKDYHFYSMEEMMARYFRLQIDKQYQESFTLDAELSDPQVEYAALDTRLPIALRMVQLLILQGKTLAGLKAANSVQAKYLQHIDPIVTGDDLMEIAQIENDAIGAFQDMHIHGERIDRPRWLTRIAGKKLEFQKLITEKLDPIFIPIVGSKTTIITDEKIAEAVAKWKAFNDKTPAEKALSTVSDRELELKKAIRDLKKSMSPETEVTALGLLSVMEEEKLAIETERKLKASELEAARKAEKEIWKTAASDLGKTRTKIRNLIDKCEGEALINYGSDTQLLKVIVGMRGLGKVTNLDDTVLEKYEHIPAMAAIREYHGLSKEIGTYGDQWALEWATKPCKEEGWLHPGDGRLHCVFNQYDAETGRSSSEKPNGQNLPKDTEVRSCFIADPPDESIRISDCCESDTVETLVTDIDGPEATCIRRCLKCSNFCSTHAEEYVIVTADMSGAELRIIAELADDPVWIGAFGRGEDVHSVGTELLYEEKWPILSLENCAYYRLHDEESVAANSKRTLGDPQRQKCKCPEHEVLRGDNKSTNFLLAYGGGPGKLSQQIKKTLQVAKDLMALHEKKFPRIWRYLENSGRNAKILKKSFDMFKRRRLFPEPTNERAKQKMIEDHADKLELDDEEAEKNIATWMTLHNTTTKPKGDELWHLTHRMPSQKEIAKTYMGMGESIGRQGKNHAIQGTNATIAKLAMGAGYCKNGLPFLWHTLPLYKAKLIKFVHDELVVQCPKRYGEKVAELIGDAFKRAAAERMSKVVMEFDFNINTFWEK